MVKRSFFGLAKPRFEYEPAVGMPVKPEKISVPKKVTLFFKETCTCGTALIKCGDKVRTGQKLSLYENSENYVIASVTGTVSALCPYTGDFGKSYTAVCIDTAEQEEPDKTFEEAAKLASLDTAKNFLACVPGISCACAFSAPAGTVKTLVVCGIDKDLLMITNPYIISTCPDDVKNGVAILKKILGAGQTVVVSGKDMMKDLSVIGGESGVEMRLVGSEYPSAFPHEMMRTLFETPVPAGKSCKDMGFCFLSAEAAASVGRAFGTGKIPVTKTLTLIKKDLTTVIVEARIGTPVGDIFRDCGVITEDKDRIIIGGPMTGYAVYSEDYPVQPDTDAVMIQGSETVNKVSDYPCINCGECVRICPAKVPVNMLVRFCETGQYETAAEEYDLHSCIECGLCSVVCTARMPVFQYIRLAKYELARIAEKEAEVEKEKEAADV